MTVVDPPDAGLRDSRLVEQHLSGRVVDELERLPAAAVEWQTLQAAAKPRTTLRTLAAAHQIRKEGKRWLVDHTQTIDTRTDPERSRKLKAEWFAVAHDRCETA